MVLLSILFGVMLLLTPMYSAIQCQTMLCVNIAKNPCGTVQKNHLKKCRPFKKITLDTAIVDRLDWWNETKEESASSSKASTSSKTTSQPSARSFAVPLFKPSEQKKINHEIAMHFCNTGTSFQRVEDPFLLQAIQIARPGAKLPTRKQLADDSPGGLLEECYAKVKSQVDKQLSSNSNYVCITSDVWSNISK